MTSGVLRDPLDEHRSSLASLSELRAQTLLASSILASALIATVLPNQGLAINAGYAAPPHGWSGSHEGSRRGLDQQAVP